MSWRRVVAPSRTITWSHAALASANLSSYGAEKLHGDTSAGVIRRRTSSFCHPCYSNSAKPFANLSDEPEAGEVIGVAFFRHQATGAAERGP